MLIHPLPDPVAFRIGPLSVHWYGLMYLFAFVQAILLGRLRLRQNHIMQAGWVKKDLDDMLFYGVLGVILGGRLGEVLFYNPVFYFTNPLEIFAVWKGGMSFHGGFLGVGIAMWFYGRKHKKGLVPILDFIAPLVPLGYALGRIGNFINGELHGRIADATLPWAMIWPNVDNLPRHPSPVYQALLDGVVVFILLWIYARKPRPLGAVTAMYTLLYGLARFMTEYFRTPDYEINLPGLTLSAGQMLSVPMILISLAVLFYVYRQRQQTGSIPPS